MTATRRLLAAAIAATLGTASAHSDSLLDIYELAVQNDPQLKAAEATYRANIEAEDLGRAALLPQINAQAYYQDAENDSESKGTDGNNIINQSTITDTETESFSLTLNQAIFDLSAWFNFRAGQKLSEQAEAQLAYDQQQLIVRVADAYFNVLRARENLDASKAEERAAKRQLEQTQERFDVGLIAITDVHESRAAYDNAVAQRLAFDGDLAIARENLSVLTGQEHGRLQSLKDSYPIAEPQPASRAEWVEFALENNYQLKVAEAGSNAAYQTARSKKMEHLPKVSGSFSYTEDDVSGTRRANPDNPFTFPPDNETETEALRLTVSMPLFSGGAVSAERRQAYEQYNASRYNAQLTQRQVVNGTRAQHIAVYTAVQRVKARKQNIVSARSALDATEAGYEVGTRNVVDVLNAQRSLYAAMRDYTNTRYDYVVNMLRLKLNAGTLSPADITNLNKWLADSEPTSLSKG